eukprot:CAMPEP_0185361688 /NCGR_PEP_ID=MMETSP1364-20130426/10487_1 /TAXON_ID=38817 /ORGANISM="Gephyrocapsa oceanica, Strain RCC1303" /LENGTH=154 /DNA_ID=CAMNT_0027962033 /DNA_START=57 /DNA_END=517 /DNA_ORIENTATION=-
MPADLDSTIKKLSKEEKAAKKAAKAAKYGAHQVAQRKKLAKKAAKAAAADAVPADVDAAVQPEAAAATDSGFKAATFVLPANPEDETLQCRDCGDDFIFTVGEQLFFKTKGFDFKKSRCCGCQAAKKARFSEESGEGGGKGKGDGGKGKGKGKG